MSSSGKGQSVIKSVSDAKLAWDYALKGSRGDLMQVIVTESSLNLTMKLLC